MPGACAFCAVAAGTSPAHLVLDEPEVLAFLDRRPVFHGHVLVVPRAHVETLLDVGAAFLGPLFGAVQRVTAAVTAGMEATGTFVAMNNVVSQSVPHLHVHVVPRRPKDGLRGFFWPRVSYPDEASMVEVAARIRARVPAGAEG